MTDNEVPQWLNDEHRKRWESVAKWRQGLRLVETHQGYLRDIAKRNRAGFLSLPGMSEAGQCACCRRYVFSDWPHAPKCPHTIWAPLLAGVPGAQP